MYYSIDFELKPFLVKRSYSKDFKGLKSPYISNLYMQDLRKVHPETHS